MSDKFLFFPIIGVCLGAVFLCIAIMTEQIFFVKIYAICLVIGVIIGIVPLGIKMLLNS